ncbi:MAG: leucine-rich repeat protein, partial [bacterium]
MKKLFAMIIAGALMIGLVGCDLNWLFPTTTSTNTMTIVTPIDETTTGDIVVTTMSTSSGSITTTGTTTVPPITTQTTTSAQMTTTTVPTTTMSNTTTTVQTTTTAIPTTTTSNATTTTSNATTTAEMTTVTTTGTTTVPPTTTQPQTTTVETTTTAVLTTTTTVPTITTVTTVVTYSVVFYDEDGTTVLKSITVPTGGDAIPPPDPVKFATAEYTYTFTGWDAPYNDVHSDLVLHATYVAVPNVYVLTYILNGGSPLDPESIAFDTILEVSTPTKENCIFLGWYLNEELTSPFTLTRMPAEDLILYALWETDPTINFAFALLEDGTYAVTGYTGTASAITIPTFYLGIPVTSIGSYLLGWENVVTSVVIPYGIVIIQPRAFNTAYHLTDVTISASVTSIGESAFSGCSALVAVTIPGSVIHIDGSAFQNCTSLVEVILEEGIESIGAYAFSRCTSLAAILIPASVASIGTGAFVFCEALTAINVQAANSVYASVNGILFNADLSTLLLYPMGRIDTGYAVPLGVTAIGDDAFNRCPYLITLSLSESVVSIGTSAFGYLTGLVSVVLPEGLTAISNYAFINCDALVAITIPTGVTTIGRYAFYHCVNLIAMTIPDNVLSVDEYAFADCALLASVTIGKGLAVLGPWAFAYCPMLASITVDAENTAFLAVDDVLYNHDQTTLILYASRKTDVDFIVPAPVRVISVNAFARCVTLVSIRLPAGLLTIEQSAFNLNSALTTVNIPLSVTTIGVNAFIGCSVLTLYVEALSKPVEWENTWNCNNRPVVWGYVPPLTSTYTFYALGGSEVAPITADEGSLMTPPVTTREGYTFLGWCYDTDLEMIMPTWIVLTNDWELYAKWSVNQYTITFAENGGSTVAVITQDFGSVVAAPDDPTWTDHVFLGWYEDDALSLPYTFTTMSANNITLYAGWSIDTSFALVAIGRYHMIAVSEDNRIFTWGQNNYGQLGNDTTVDAANPVEITAFFTFNPGEYVKYVDVTDAATILITSTGRIFTWGYNGEGILADGTTNDRHVPMEVTDFFGFGSGEYVTSLVTGIGHALILTENDMTGINRVLSWGWNAY